MSFMSKYLSYFGLGGLNSPDKGPQTNNISTATDAGISVSDERALQLSSVWDCVQKIVNAVSSLPLVFYDVDGKDLKEIEGNHYLKDLLIGRPNPYMKSRDFRKAITCQLCLWQNAYARIEWNTAKTKPLALYPLKPGRMTPFITDQGELQYHYNTDKGVIIYAKESIMHFKGFGIDGITGLNRADMAKKTYGISVSADVYASKQFASGGKSGGGRLMFDKFLNEKQRIQARELYSGMSETAYNKGNLWLIEGGAKYEADDVNPDTMQMLETRGFQIGETARFFGVPEALIGGGSQSDAWPASLEVHLLAFLQFTLQDYIDEWEATIMDSLVKLEDRRKLAVEHDVSNFVKMDAETKVKVQSTQVQNGIKKRNEIRKANKDPEDPNGNELTVQVNLTDIGDLPKAGKPATSLETVQQ